MKKSISCCLSHIKIQPHFWFRALLAWSVQIPLLIQTRRLFPPKKNYIMYRGLVFNDSSLMNWSGVDDCDFYQLFGLSFWRHPFTASEGMLHFPKSVLMKKHLWCWVHFQLILIFASNACCLSCCEWTACVCTISVDWLRALTALWRGVSPSLDLKSTWAPFSTRTRIPSTLRLPWTARVRGVSEKQMKTDTTLQLQKNSFI